MSGRPGSNRRVTGWKPVAFPLGYARILFLSAKPSDLMHTLALTDAQFKAEVLDSKTPVLVDFWATWCAPCVAMEPVLESIAAQHLGKLKVVKVNVEQNQLTAQAFEVRSLPNFLLFNGGKVVSQVAGAVSKQKLEEAIQKVL